MCDGIHFLCIWNSTIVYKKVQSTVRVQYLAMMGLTAATCALRLVTIPSTVRCALRDSLTTLDATLEMTSESVDVPPLTPITTLHM